MDWTLSIRCDPPAILGVYMPSIEAAIEAARTETRPERGQQPRPCLPAWVASCVDAWVVAGLCCGVPATLQRDEHEVTINSPWTCGGVEIEATSSKHDSCRFQ